jgi:putative endonuclease
MAQRKTPETNCPLFDWAAEKDARDRDERRQIARPRRRGSREQGTLSHLSGLAAEDTVARHYERSGHPTAALRWRGTHGEIDLIAQNGAGLIFVEVKRADSFDRAAHYLTDRQAQRIYDAASEYLGSMPKGQLTEVRLDLALVNGRGEVQVIENAIRM